MKFYPYILLLTVLLCSCLPYRSGLKMSAGIRIAEKKGNEAKAIRYFDRAYALDSTNLEALENKAVALRALGRLSDSKQILLKAREKGYTGDANWYYTMGEIYQQTENSRTAIAYYDSAIAINNTESDFYRNKAYCYEKGIDSGLAVLNYEKALNLTPKDFDTNKYYGLFLLCKEEYPRSKSLLLAADKIDQEDAEVHAALYRLYLKEGDLKTACLHYNKAKTLDKDITLPSSATCDQTKLNNH